MRASVDEKAAEAVQHPATEPHRRAGDAECSDHRTGGIAHGCGDGPEARLQLLDGGRIAPRAHVVEAEILRRRDGMGSERLERTGRDGQGAVRIEDLAERRAVRGDATADPAGRAEEVAAVALVEELDCAE